MIFGDLSPILSDQLLSRGGRGANQPPFHVVFYIQEIFETNPPGFAGSGFQHETPEFWMEDWEWIRLSVSI